MPHLFQRACEDQGNYTTNGLLVKSNLFPSGASELCGVPPAGTHDPKGHLTVSSAQSVGKTKQRNEVGTGQPSPKLTAPRDTRSNAGLGRSERQMGNQNSTRLEE